MRGPAPILVDPGSQWRKVAACEREREFAGNGDDAAVGAGVLAKLGLLVGLLAVAAVIPALPYSCESGWSDDTEDHQCYARKGDTVDL